MTVYLVKVIGCSGLLLLAYWLLLERERILRFNRFYLLLAIVFSFAIPLVTVQKTIPRTVVNEMMVALNPDVSNHPALQEAATKPQNVWPIVLGLIYVSITAALGFRFVQNLLLLFKSIRQNEKTNFENAKVVLLDRETTPYSFFQYLFASKGDFSQGKIAQQILQHELAHVRQRHSIDIMCLEIILIFAWVNPIFFLYRRAIQLNHEFLADDSATASGNISEYQLLLVGESCPDENLRLSSSFNYLFTKKRLIMMTKKTSLRTAIGKELTMFSLLVLCAFVFGGRATAQQVKKDSPQAKKDVQQSNKEAKTYVSVRAIDAKNASPSSAQAWTLKYDGGTVQFKSQKPLTDAEKKRIEQEFVKNTSTPLPKFAPTQYQLESFLDATVYGVWINGKRIVNSELKKYSAKDFNEVFVSVLMKNAKDYGKYLFHVELKKKDGC